MKKILCFVLSIMMLTALFAAPVTAGASAPVPEKKLVTSLTMNRSVEAWGYNANDTAEYDETDGTIDTYKGKFDSATGIFTIPVPKGYKSKSVTQGDGCTLELGAADISAYTAEGAKAYIGFKIKGNAYPTAMNPNLRSSGGRAYLSSPYYVMNELVPDEWNEVYIPLSDYTYEDNFDKTAFYRLRFTIDEGSATEKIDMELKDFGIYKDEVNAMPFALNRSVEAWAYDAGKTAKYDDTDGAIGTYKGSLDKTTGIFTIPVPKGYESIGGTQGDGCTLELNAADISAFTSAEAKAYLGFKIKGNAYPTYMNPNLRSSGGRAYLPNPYYVMNELVPNEWNEVYIPLSDYVYEDNFDKTALYRIRFTIGKGSETEKINMELKDFGIYISAEEANKFEITDFKITVNSAAAETYSEDDVLTFSANAKNTTASDVDFVVVAATYDKLGNINSAKLFNMKSVASTGKIAGDTAQITATSEDETVRAFCWSGVSDLTPLAPVQRAAKSNN